ncbi:metal-binding protein [Clostridium ganghwense]|uniref:Metal-binding protein n=1 Tax=Clostridium ganghwense TaxID=312089 RepID=A0ABT4CM83_9CLOT|nr:metal-binding protein [Clostridium ganghwense]MCY6370162.1 metal-binding protein [Clostridium ganghwense]
MVLHDIMKYIESEYDIINSTPCEVCGDSYIAEDLEIHIVNDIPYDVCICTCAKCGHEKLFKFCAPFTDEELLQEAKKSMQ